MAINARRATCIEGCNATITKVNADSISRDAKCVKKCNARKTPHRRTTECIQRCPEIAVAATVNDYESAKTTRDISNEASTGKTIAVTKDGMEMHPHPSLPMLNKAFVEEAEDPEHPSIPMFSTK